MFILDEADSFFLGNNHIDEIKRFDGILKKVGHRVQYVFFSATYDHNVSDDISQIIDEAI
jgi:superfamily II DNA/RNA helicase